LKQTQDAILVAAMVLTKKKTRKKGIVDRTQKREDHVEAKQKKSNGHGGPANAREKKGGFR